MIHKEMKNTIRFLALALCLPFAVAAVSPYCDASVAKVRLLAFNRVGDDMEVNITDTQGMQLSSGPVALPTQQLSPYEDISDRSLIFTSKSDPKKILGKVVLPAIGSEFVLVFLPAPEGSSQVYDVDAVALPSSGFRSGDYAFINYSGVAVGCVIAGDRLMVAHGKSAVYQSAKSGKGPGNRTIVCYSQKQGAWESPPFLSSRIIIQKGVRNLVLICRNPKTGEIDFRGIPDFVE